MRSIATCGANVPPAADGEEIAAARGPPEQSLALGLRQWLGVALRDQNLRRDLFGAAVPVAESVCVFFREPRHVGNGLFAVAAEYQSRAVTVRLAELVTRRNVGDTVFKTEVFEPRRLGNVEMIDGMQIVVEARRRHFLGREPAAILQAPVDQQDAQARLRQVAAQNQAVMAGADDDAVVGLFQRLGHAFLLRVLP
jgi:hypothetical protein